MFMAEVFPRAKARKQPKCPTTGDWMRRCGAYAQWKPTQPRQSETVPLAATEMDVQGIMLSERSQPEKDTYCIIALKYGM